MPAAKITWTRTDEAPALATYALLPIVEAFFGEAGIAIESADLSLAGRILANFPERLREDQKVPDELSRLEKLARTPDANIVKLPNISASLPQLQEAIAELQSQGCDIPSYPEYPGTDTERTLQTRYATILGSAVNPVLREGNSDRRPAAAVKRFAQKHPHGMMKDWPESGSLTRVAHMHEMDFLGSETSITTHASTTARIEFVDAAGRATVVKDGIAVARGEVLDTAVMNVAALRSFYREQMKRAKQDNMLLSLHLKCTMMKVSDPAMFGHCVSVYFADALDKHADTLREIRANVNNGLAGILDKLNRLPDAVKSDIEAGIDACYRSGPALAMVDSRKGTTNLHAPNDVIVDASMPAMIRDGGHMWNRENVLQDTVAMIPDRCYATIYQAMVEDCQRHGQFDPATMGSVSNVGLMAMKAEEYGSHDKTFIAAAKGTIRVVDTTGKMLLRQSVEPGDIFRMCQTADAAIRDWVKLAVTRARATDAPTIFWLDENRGHDVEVIRKVRAYLSENDTAGLDIRIMTPVDAMNFTLVRVRRGENTISITGNVLRDYLTDLFPILELGTSARVLSIVPLLQGGGLFETGAGGSAPRHVEQFIREGHLRWDSLGEYCALVPSLELMARQTGNAKAQVLADTLDEAVARYLEDARYPSRKVGEIDNRGSTFYLALAWACALAAQAEDAVLARRFEPVAAALAENERTIMAELLVAQGSRVDLGGYYRPDGKKCAAAMRPSATLNRIIDAM